MNIFDHEYSVYLMACKDAIPPFYSGPQRENFSAIVKTLQKQAGMPGDVTADIYHVKEDKDQRAKGLSLDDTTESVWEIVPFKFDDNNRLSTLYVTIPPYAYTVEHTVPTTCMIRVIYHHQNPSSSADFLVMLAILSDTKKSMGESFQNLLDSVIRFFSPV